MYDVIRMFIMLDLLLTVIPLGEEPRLRWFPSLVYAAPNAIFPLMGFFLLIRPGEYRPFTQLYLAGKTVSLAAALGWFLFSFQALIASMSPGGEASFRAFITALLLSEEFLFFLRGVFLLLILDAASLFLGRVLQKRLYAPAPPEVREIPGEDPPGGGPL